MKTVMSIINNQMTQYLVIKITTIAASISFIIWSAKRTERLNSAWWHTSVRATIKRIVKKRKINISHTNGSMTNEMSFKCLRSEIKWKYLVNKNSVYICQLIFWMADRLLHYVNIGKALIECPKKWELINT